MKPEIAEHLRFYAELGVDGFSTDPAWRRRRQGAGSEAIAEPSPGSASAVDAPMGAAAGAVARPANSATLALIRSDIGDCTRCKLHSGRTNLVFGVGNPEADLMFVGEGPGADEDEQGIPFVGRAGQLLTQIIRAMGYERDDVYIANVVKCRPPGNRNPEPDEIAQCEPFLLRQIDAVAPRVIVALGKFAAQVLLRSAEPISRLRGRFHAVRDTQVMPTFHPSYLLRTPSAKREVWDDMKQVMALLRESR